MATPARRPLEPLALSALVASSSSSSHRDLAPHGVIRGRLTRIRPYSPHTRLAQLTLASLDPADPPGTALDLELKGDIALRASRRLHKGDTLILSTKGASTALTRSEGEKGGDRRAGRVRFAELTGWVRRKNGDEEFLHYARASPLPCPSVPAHGADVPHCAEPAKPKAPPPRLLEPRQPAPPPPPPQPAPPALAAAPVSAPAPSTKRPRTSTPTPPGPKKVSPPGGGARSRKRLKAAAAADALASWNLTAVRPSLSLSFF